MTKNLIAGLVAVGFLLSSQPSAEAGGFLAKLLGKCKPECCEPEAPTCCEEPEPECPAPEPTCECAEPEPVPCCEPAPEPTCCPEPEPAPCCEAPAEPAPCCAAVVTPSGTTIVWHHSYAPQYRIVSVSPAKIVAPAQTIVMQPTTSIPSRTTQLVRYLDVR